MPVTYDPNVDYSDLIAQEAAKGVNANKQLLAQYETQRNAKIADQNLGYAQTHIYTGSDYGGNGSYSYGAGGSYGSSGGVGNVSGGYYTARDNSAYINQLFDAADRSVQEALKGAYDQQVLGFDRTEEQIPIVYRDARNMADADAAITRANVNEQLAASGLNTGAAGQVRLALGVQAQNNLNALTQQQASALADLELQRAEANAAYRSAVAEAIANNDIQRAQALYEEAVRVDNSWRSNIDDALANMQLQSYQLELDSARQQMALDAASAVTGGVTGGSSTPSASSPQRNPAPAQTADPTITNRNGDGWVYVPGLGRYTYSELESKVNSGQVSEVYNATNNTLTYTKR